MQLRLGLEMDRDPLVNGSSNEYLPKLSLLPDKLQCVLAGRSCVVMGQHEPSNFQNKLTYPRRNPVISGCLDMCMSWDHVVHAMRMCICLEARNECS